MKDTAAASRCILYHLALSVLMFLLIPPFSATAGGATNSIILDGTQASYDLRDYVEVLQNRNYTIKQVASPEFADKFIKPGPDFFPGQSPDGYWMRFSVSSPLPEDLSDWCIHLTPPLMKEFTLYRPASDRNAQQGFTRWDAGYDNPESTSWEGKLPYAEKIAFPSGTTEIYYILWNAENHYYDPFYLSTPAHFFQSRNRTDIFFFILIGAATGLILYNLFLFFALRDTSYLWYVLQSTSFTTYYFILMDYSPRFLHIPQQYIITINYGLIGLFFIFSSMFVKSFLNTKKRTRFIHILLNICTFISFLILPLCAVFDMIIVETVYSFWIMFIFIAYTSSGIASYLKGQRSARYFISAWLVFGGSIAFASIEGLTPGVAMNKIFMTLQVMNVIEMLLLSLALADRISILRRDRESAEALSRAKSAFLASMSHEIRTPINTIMGMNDLVLKTELSEDQFDKLTVVREATDHLLCIINDILDFSKIESGKLELEHTHFNLHRTIESAMESIRVQAEQKGLQLNSDISPDVPEVVQGDPVRLRQVLLNLLSNSIKFTAEGDISLKVAMHSPGIPVFSVTDTGIGVPEALQDTIFDQFTQAEDSITREFGGTGLGLSISRQLVEMMGGKIEVRSTPGKGSMFFFTAALPPGDPALIPPETVSRLSLFTSQNARPLRILAAEDNTNNTRLLQAILAQTPHEVQFAANGREALATLSAESFDIVLMDLEMPEMSGLEAAQAVRRGEAGTRNADIPIIALTAHALAEVRQSCLDAGMNGFITKPFKIEELLTALSPSCVRGDISTELKSLDQDNAVPLVFNKTGFQTMFGEDESTFERIKNAFLDELPEQLSAMENALKNREWESLHKKAHYFKTSVGVVCAERLSVSVTELGKAVQKYNGPEAEEHFSNILDELEALKAEWQQ